MCRPPGRRRVAADVNQRDNEQKKAESKGFVYSAKQGIELIGLLPTVVGCFKITPQWFTPSTFYQPDIAYCDAGASFVTYVVTLVYLHRVGTPIEQWQKKDRKRHFIDLGGHPKTGQSRSPQNRPTGTSQDKP